MFDGLLLLAAIPAAAVGFRAGVWWRTATTYGRHAVRRPTGFA